MVLTHIGNTMTRWYVLWHIELWHYSRMCMHIHTLGYFRHGSFIQLSKLFSLLFIIIHLSFFILWIMFVSCRWYFGTFWLVPWPTLARVLPVPTRKMLKVCFNFYLKYLFKVSFKSIVQKCIQSIFKKFIWSII